MIGLNKEGRINRKTSIRALFFLILLIATAVSYYFFAKTFAATTGSTYYVNTLTGNDNNNGTSTSTPWKSINKVTNTNFQAGDRILFSAGQVFNGHLQFNSSDLGTASSPIVISSYGTGRATLHGLNSRAVTVYNTAGIEFQNINFTGDNTAFDGLNFYNDISNTKLDHITINDVEVSGFGQDGIVVGGWNGTAGFKNVRITNVSSHDNQKNGFITYGQGYYSNQNVYVGNSKFYNNWAISGLIDNAGGSGVVLGSVDSGVIEYSLAYENGKNCTANAPEVPEDQRGGCGCGFWAYNSNNITIQYNESYNNRTGGLGDGNGLDIDQNTTNSKIQYNYTHGNDGPGILLAHKSTDSTHKNANNVIRYNISQNDARKLGGAGAIETWGGTENTEIYNNSVYITPNSSSTVPYGMAIFVDAGPINGLHIRNNIFQSASGAGLVYLSNTSNVSNLLFQGNDYFSTGSNFKINWAGSSYSSLDAWRTGKNQEKLNGQNVGYSVDPQFQNPGGGATISDPTKLSSLSAYKLKDSSTLIDKALNLKTLFNIDFGIRDFYGTLLPAENLDLGAYEKPSSANISVVKSVSPSQNVSPGTVLTYSLKVTNNSLTAGNNVVLTENIPPGTTYEINSATSPGIYNSGTNSLTWNWPTFPGQNTITVSFSVKVN